MGERSDPFCPLSESGRRREMGETSCRGPEPSRGGKPLPMPGGWLGHIEEPRFRFGVFLSVGKIISKRDAEKRIRSLN